MTKLIPTDLSVALPNAQGFTILGGAAYDQSGSSVSDAGDVNKDGYADIIIGAYLADTSSRSKPGKSYVIYGGPVNPGTINLSVALTNAQGFAILGGATGDQSGRSVSAAGDVNNDGYADIIIGAYHPDFSSRTDAGKSYVIYGSATNPGTIDLSVALTSTQGFVILGEAISVSDYGAHYSLSAAGDVNNDGYADIIIGTKYASPNSRSIAGKSYVIYGSAINPGTIDLSVALTSTQGFAILGGARGDRSGVSVSSAGDINKDGYADIIIGANNASPNSRSQAGASYVIYGSAANPGTIDLSVALTSTQGFAVLGGAANDLSGYSASAAGDFNKDGYADIIIGTSHALPFRIGTLHQSPLSTSVGKSYVIYGNATNPGTIDLSVALTSTQGFVILSEAVNDYSGRSVSAAGDVNNDGYADIIIGAYNADPSSRSGAGKSYVIYGSATNPGTIDLSVALTSTQGFAILGGARGAQSGVSVSAAGDLNKDGYADIIIGASMESPSSRWNAGQSYVIYGGAANPGTIDLSVALGNNALNETEANNSDCSESATCDALKTSPNLEQIEDGYSTETPLVPPVTNIIYTLLSNNRIISIAAGAASVIIAISINMFIKAIFRPNQQNDGIAEKRTNSIVSTELLVDSAITVIPKIYPEMTPTDRTLTNNEPNALNNALKAEATALLCIDASMDSKYIKMQDKAFAEFGQHLMVVYRDLSATLSNGVRETQKLLGASSSEDANAVIRYQEPAANKPESSTSNHLMLSLFSIRQLIEYLPLIKYVAQGTSDYFGLNVTIPTILDNKPLLFTMHLVAGHASAMLLPNDAVNNGLAVSTAGSLGYGARFVASNYLNEQRQEVVSSDKPMELLELAKYCGTTILAYTLPNIVSCLTTKFAIPGTECSITGYDLAISASLGGAECYSMYKVATQDNHKTTADIVVPYIADAVATVFASQYMSFDSNNLAAMMMSVKQNIALVGSVVAVDYISRIAMDAVPDDVKETYIDSALLHICDVSHNVYQAGAHFIEEANTMMGYFTAPVLEA